MGKKKPSGGKNKKPRTPVQMPTDWLDVARARAKLARQPVLWYIIALIEKDARDAGITKLPPPPWDKGVNTTDAAGSSQSPPADE